MQNEDGPQRTHSLDSGQSQTLKVSPTRKVLSLISYGKGGASEKVGNVINLHFEGNWMPLKVCCMSPATLPDRADCWDIGQSTPCVASPCLAFFAW